MSLQPSASRRSPDSLADVLERVLDKGVVIAGDIVVNVLDIELLTLKLRLFIASAETAREMGMDWWTRDPFFSSEAGRSVADGGGQERQEMEADRLRALEVENDDLRQRLAALESTARPELHGAESDRSGDPERADEPRRTDR